MDPEAFAHDQLAHKYARIHFDKDTSSKIRNWCITVWAGSVAFASSATLSRPRQIALSALPILCFWVLDAMQHMFIQIHSQQARWLERVLLGLDPMDVSLLQTRTVTGALNNDPWMAKFRIFLHCALATETVTAFYVALLAGTCVFAFLR